MALTVTYEGVVNYANYLANNPVKLKITSNELSKIKVSCEGKNLEYIAIPSIPVYVELTNLVKGLFSEDSIFVESIKNNANNMWGYTFIRPQIDVEVKTINGSETDTNTFNPSFLKGSDQGNIINRMLSPIPNGEITLSNSVLIPKWSGYPIKRYSILGSGDLNGTDDVKISDPTSAQIENMYSINECNPLYIAFLNSMGGYSFWLFESYEYSEDSKDFEKVTTGYDLTYYLGSGAEKFINTGGVTRASVEVEGSVPRRYFGLMQDLAKSPEVWVYNGNGEIDGSKSANDWQRVTNAGNKYAVSDDELEKKFKFNFTVENTENRGLSW